MTRTGLVLASASPARLATLRSAGVEPRVVVSGVDESVVQETDPAVLVCRLAELKVQAVVAEVEGEQDAPRWVLGCDSMLALDREVLGKPADAAAGPACSTPGTAWWTWSAAGW